MVYGQSLPSIVNLEKDNVINMIKFLKSRSEFTKHVLTLMTGTTIAQAIPIAITPILTRLYTPEDFGLLALFVSITVTLGSISNGRYELAILLPEKDEDAINIAALGLIIATCMSLLLLAVVFVFNEDITRILKNPDIGIWLYVVPLVVLITGLFNVLNYLNTRKRLYMDIAKTNMYKSSVLATVQVGVGYLKAGVSGLVLGQILSTLLANYRLAKNVILNFELKTISIKKIEKLSKRYISFPKYSVLAILANNLSTHLINLLVSIYFNITTLGFYYMAQKILGMPSTLIGSSISQVFFKQGSEERLETGKVISTFDSTIKKLIVLSLILYTFLFFIVEDVFAVILGENWRIAGSYSMILIPMFCTRFVVSSVSAVDTIMEKQHIFLMFNISLLMISLVVIYFAREWPFIEFLKLYSLSIMSVYIVYGFILRMMAKDAF